MDSTLNNILKNLALPGMFGSLGVTSVIVFAIVTRQSLLTSASLGVTIGGLLGPIIIIYLKKRNKRKLSKRNIEINQIFDSYANQTITWIAIGLYLILTNYLIYQFNTGNTLSFDNFIFYLMFSCISTINLYSGVGYYTAWLNYKKANNL